MKHSWNFISGAAAVLIICLVRTGSAIAWPAPDTGQTTCYDAAGQVITCPGAGEPFYGQDGNYTINPPSYAKLDSGGNPLPDDAASWAMVKDNVTGLIWEVKQDMDGAKNYSNPHDADNTYTWYDSNPATNGGYAGAPGNGTDTEDFINALNSAHFGEYSDWRLPGIKELASIVNYGIPYPGPTIYTGYFPRTKPLPFLYWSSTTSVNGTANARGVYFDNGGDMTGGKVSSGYVRAVRGGQ